MATLPTTDCYKRYILWLLMSLIVLQLCIGTLTSVSMISMNCDMQQADMSIMTAHHDDTQCHARSPQSMRCFQLCACFNAFMPVFQMPQIAASFVLHLIAHPLLAGVQFAPPLPPP